MNLAWHVRTQWNPAKSNDDSIEKQEPVKEMNVPPEKRDEILNKLRKVFVIKMEYYKISKILNDLTVSKFLTKNGSK